MPCNPDIAVIGATGLLGESLVQLLAERDFPLRALYLLGQGEALGQSLSFRGKNLRVQALESFDFSQVQLVFLAATDAVSPEQCEVIRRAGCSVIGLAGALGGIQAPAVVPEVNAQLLEQLKPPYLLSSPEPGAVVVALVLAALSEWVAPLSVSITACLSASVRGQRGVSELARQTVELLNGRPIESQLFDGQVAFNILPSIAAVDEQGHADIEKRLAADLQILLSRPQLDIAVSCLQVPVFFGDSYVVSLRTAAACDLPAIRLALADTPGVEYHADENPSVVADAIGQDAVHVGRVRGAMNGGAGLNLWIVSDNVRKGSALNAVQLAELLIKDHL